MSAIRLSHPNRKLHGTVHLPGSKSESNRALILQALSGGAFPIHQLSEADDTKILRDILRSDSLQADVQDAGTAMRFLTAYYAATNQHKILTGSPRMLQRPMEPLVTALNELGFYIRYLGKEGFAPLEIIPVDILNEVKIEVYIDGAISSQFISALLLVAPYLPVGLALHLTTPPSSLPYLEMTLEMLAYFGVAHQWQGQTIRVLPAPLKPRDFTVGADWTAASYWYAMAFLADDAELTLSGLQDRWLQGDRQTADWMKRFSVQTEFNRHGAQIRKTHQPYPQIIKLNFRDHPDLAQTFAVLFAAKDISATFTGLDSLRLKETDRVLALQQQLAHCGYRMDFAEEFQFYQLRGKFVPPVQSIQTYGDHRMAMSFAALGLRHPVVIEHPEVVTKSYPGFWQELMNVGFEIKEV